MDRMALVSMNKGQKISDSTRLKMRMAAYKRMELYPYTKVGGWNKGVKTQQQPKNYKGESASYSAHHHWIKYHKGRAEKCQNCGLNEIPPEQTRYFEWANVSGLYLRNVDDWVELCVRCHRLIDDTGRKAWAKRRMT